MDRRWRRLALFCIGIVDEVMRYPQRSQKKAYISARENFLKGARAALMGEPCPKNGAARVAWVWWWERFGGKAQKTFIHSRGRRAQKLGADSQEAPPKSLPSSPLGGGMDLGNVERPMFGKGSRGGLQRRDNDSS